MTDFGRRAGLGDMLKSVYDPNEDGVIALAQTEADMTSAVYGPVLAQVVAMLEDHKERHESGGDDEIDCSGLVGAGGAGILGDGTPNRHLRSSHLYFKDGTQANEIKMTLADNWNGDAIAETDDIGKGETVGHFTWKANGTKLTVEAAGLSGNVLAAYGIVWKNALADITRSHLTILAVASANDIAVEFYEQGTGNSLDIDELTNYGDIFCTIIYVTDA